MYRAVTLHLLRENLIGSSLASIEAQLNKIKIAFRINEKGKSSIYLNGENIDDEIYGMKVAGHVSEVSTISIIRNAMVGLQHELGKNKGIIMDGRDIGTVVFPEASLKLFLTSSIETRAQRRYLELQAKGKTVSLEEVKENLEHRDLIDTTRDMSPLRMAEDSILIDNTNLSRQEQLVMIHALAKARING